MTPREILELAERFMAAIQTGDGEAVRACYAPDARIWHNFDNVEQTVGQNLKVLRWMARKLPERRYRVLRREPLSDGFLQQHVLEATLPDGTAWAMPACVVVRMDEGRITRLDEYLDSAHSAALAALLAPTRSPPINAITAITADRTERFAPEHLDAWRRDGGVSIQGFFTPDEVAAVEADFRALFGESEAAAEALVKKREGQVGRFHPSQFKGVAPVPLDCSPALNLIGVHPALIAFAKVALGADKVHLYQCQAWAKFTGESDYDQPFHCDFSNHTLTAPSEDAHLNSVTILCYFSDVTEAHGPAHYVSRPDSLKVAGPEASLTRDGEVHARIQAALVPYERSTAAPAGSVFPYAIDVWHRGTNLTAPGGHRYALMTCFRATGNDSIGFHAWPFHHTQPWARIFDHATPEQLECFGVQPPGHPFWTEVTLARAQTRYPNWDLSPYREAIKAKVA